MSNSAFSPSVLTVPSGTTGSGELNLITNPVAVTNTTGWVGAGRGTSGGPLNPTIETYFTVLNTAGSESSTSGAYDVISLPSGLQNKKLKVEFYFTSPAVDTFKVSVYKGTTRVPLTTDVSGSTALPQNTTGKFVAYFDTDSSGTWTVSITRTAGTGGTALQFTNVVVGPGIQPQGAVVGEWQSYTPAGSFNTNTTYTGKYRRVGDSAEILMDLSFTGAPNVTALTFTSAQFLNGLNLTVDTSKLPNNTETRNPFGTWTGIDNGSNGAYGGQVAWNNSQAELTYFGGTWSGVTNAGPVAWGNLDNIGIRATIPIAEWAGSGTVQLAQNDVEFASNDGSAGVAANTAYTTGMVYGPSGSNFVAVASTTTNASTDYLVRFQTPVQNTDLIQIEAQDGTGTWNLISNYSASPIRTYQNQANSYYGLGWYRHPTVNTDIYVQFGNMGSGPNTTVSTAYAAAGNTWSGFTGRKWRVRKSSAGAAVGFGIVVPGVSSGLVSASGLPGNTTGNVVAAGYVGEVVQLTGQQTLAVSGTYYSFGGTTIQPGTYLVSLNAQVNGVGALQVLGAISQTSTSSASIDAAGVGSSADFYYAGSQATAAGTNTLRTSGSWILRVTTAGTYYTRVSYAGTSGTVLGWATLTRIA